jgi:hypothetical protein
MDNNLCGHSHTIQYSKLRVWHYLCNNRIEYSVILAVRKYVGQDFRSLTFIGSIEYVFDP